MKSSFTLHDLPHTERPRERLTKFGSEALSAQELIALILGRGVAGESVMVTSQKLLSQFGSLDAMLDASIEDLCQIKGIGLAKSCQIKAIFEIVKRVKGKEIGAQKKKSLLSPREIFELLVPQIGYLKKEHFVLVSFDTRNRVIGTDTISIGTLNASLVHPREMFNIAIRRHAASVIISHNHPSGDPDPSDEDIRVTEKLTEAGKLLGILVLDHVIICKESYYSFSENK
jgi:DNA repair protein RadC